MIALSTSRLAAASLPVTSPIRRGSAGQRALALGREEALGGELALQPLERGEVRRRGRSARSMSARSRKSPRGLEQLRPSEDVDALAVREVEPERVELPARHRHAEARAVGRVLEREEDALPALLAAQLGDLALDPDRRQPREPVGDAAVERGHGVDRAVAVLDRLDLHALMLRPRLRPARAPITGPAGWRKLSRFRPDACARWPIRSPRVAGGTCSPPWVGTCARRPLRRPRAGSRPRSSARSPGG